MNYKKMIYTRIPVGSIMWVSAEIFTTASRLRVVVLEHNKAPSLPPLHAATCR